jgi:hypothetical protein
MGPMRIFTGFACAAIVACSPPALPGPPHAATSNDPDGVACPEGKPARAGLDNFGAYIGTWEQNRPHDRQFPSDYSIGTIQGHVAVRCSANGFVVVERIHPLFASPEGQALRVALTEVPDDSEKVYDHIHAGCRVLQYRSPKLARQLGADDTDGRVGFVFQSDGAAYYSGAVKSIVLDLYDRLGADTRGC